jgi:hypothetical protein
MAERLEPTEALLALMRDIADRHVLDNDDMVPMLELPGDPPADVRDMVWAMYRAGWALVPAGSVVWELTAAGREVLDRGMP